MSATRTSLATVAAGFDALWKLRARRNDIDAELLVLQAGPCSEKDRARIAKLVQRRADLVERINALSAHARGMATATARRIAG